MTTAILTARGPLSHAAIEIVYPESFPPVVIPLRFNPTEYQLQKSNSFQEIAIPGLQAPPIQYIRGNSEKLAVEVLADTTDSLEDVRTKYVKQVRDLLEINKDLHAPPIVRFTWDKEIFKGVLESFQVTYTLFSPEGAPLRAKMSLSFKEYRPVEVQVKEPPRQSPDFDKAYVVRYGDSLASLAFSAYKDATQWRKIATANALLNPRRLAPGLVLKIPKIR